MAKRTALYDRHVALGGKMVDFAGFELPVQYSGILEEHRAVRTAAGLFDVSHMGEFLFEGEGAESALNALLTNDIRGMADGKVRYSLMANERGGAVDDVLVYRFDGKKFLVVVNAANTDKDRAWVLNHLAGGCGFSDISEDVAQLAIQGPSSERILRAVAADADLPAKYYTFKEKIVLCGVETVVSRTGYTGEDGFEIYCRAEYVGSIYDALIDAGKEYGMLPCGLGARDTLRLEAGMPLYGHELGEDIPVDEVGLDFAVKTDKEYFVGLDAIKTHMAEYERIGARVAGKGIVREHCEIYADGQSVGVSTSGTHSPTLGVGICMLRVRRGETRPLFADVRGRSVALERVPLPFVGRKK